MLKITVEARPSDDEFCGQCPQLVKSTIPALFFCRQFSENFGYLDHSLGIDDRGRLLRHEKCKELT